MNDLGQWIAAIGDAVAAEDPDAVRALAAAMPPLAAHMTKREAIATAVYHKFLDNGNYERSADSAVQAADDLLEALREGEAK